MVYTRLYTSCKWTEHHILAWPTHLLVVIVCTYELWISLLNIVVCAYVCACLCSCAGVCASVLPFQMEYCSSALCWIVDTLAQNSTFKPPRPPPMFRGAESLHLCNSVLGCGYIHQSLFHTQKKIKTGNSIRHLFFFSDTVPSSSISP